MEPQLRLEVTVRQLTKMASVVVQNAIDGDTASRCSTLSRMPSKGPPSKVTVARGSSVRRFCEL